MQDLEAAEIYGRARHGESMKEIAPANQKVPTFGGKTVVNLSTRLHADAHFLRDRRQWLSPTVNTSRSPGQ